MVSVLDEVEYSLIDSHFLSSEAVGVEEGFLEYEAQYTLQRMFEHSSPPLLKMHLNVRSVVVVVVISFLCTGSVSLVDDEPLPPPVNSYPLSFFGSYPSSSLEQLTAVIAIANVKMLVKNFRFFIIVIFVLFLPVRNPLYVISHWGSDNPLWVYIIFMQM